MKQKESIGCWGCLGCGTLLMMMLGVLGFILEFFQTGRHQYDVGELATGLFGAMVIGAPALYIFLKAKKRANRNKELNQRRSVGCHSSNSPYGDTKSQFVCKTCSTVCTAGTHGDYGKYKCPKCVDGKLRFLGDCCIDHSHPKTCKACGKAVKIYSWTGKGWRSG